MCATIYGVVYQDPNPKINGRKGQDQGGVDVFVNTNGGKRIGVQCKKYFRIKLEWKHIEEEVKKADKELIPIKTMLIATTSPSDATLLHKVQLLSDERDAQGLFTLEIDFWEDIENHINRHVVLQDSYTPYSPGAAYHRQGQKLDRIKDLALDHQDAIANLADIPVVLNSFINKITTTHLDRANELIFSDKTSEGSSQAERLSRLSQMAFDECGLIQSDSSKLTRSGHIWLRDLYVTRTIEKEIDDWLTRPDEAAADVIFIIGSAGFGKTSVLWNTFRRYQPNSEWRPLFIKSSWLLPAQGNNTLAITPHEILAALRELSIKGKPLLLIDTIDLLLHDEANRFLLYELISQASEIGAHMVVSTRPVEVRQFPLRVQSIKTVDLFLQRYNEGEFAEAISRYASVFYASGADISPEAETERIKSAVASGRPLREVCLNPLSLRMLFSLYAPNEVSTEVNVFRLYCDFWKSRVETDARVGEKLEGKANDFSHTAFNLALTMLYHGVPVIFHGQLDGLVQDGYIEREAIRVLASRGVLSHTGESVEFFHQTFFEHAAGRAMLNRHKENALSVFEKRVKERPNDLFIHPAYEQALLLASMRTGTAKQFASEALRSLLDDRHPSFLTSALNVYVLSDSADKEVVEQVKQLLSEGQEFLAVRFIELLPNINPRRVMEVVGLLEVIWRHESWRIKQHSQRLLLWLANVDWDSAFAFIESNRVFEVFLKSAPDSFPIEKYLLEIMKVGGRLNPIWAREWLFKLVIQQRSPERLVEFVIKNPSIFSPRDAADSIVSCLFGNLEVSSNANVALPPVLGNLYCTQWRACGKNISDIIRDVSVTPTGIVFRSKIRGLVGYMSQAAASDFQCIISAICEEADSQRKWGWIDCFVRQFLLITPDASAHGGRNQLIDWLKDSLIAELHEKHHAEDNASRSMLLKIMLSTGLSRTERLSIISSLSHLSADDWSNTHVLGRYLTDGLFLGIREAIDAFEILLKNPDTRPDLCKIIKASFQADYFFASEALLSYSISWCQATSDISIIGIAIEHAQIDQIMLLSQHLHIVERMCEKAVLSKASQQRRRAFDLWMRLIEVGLMSPPSCTTAINYFDRETNSEVKDSLFRILGYISYQDEVQFRDLVLRILSPQKKPRVSGTRAALSAFTRLLNGYTGDPRPYLPQAIKLIVSDGADEWQLRQFSIVLESLTRGNLTNEAVDYALQYLQSSAVTKLGVTGKRTLEHHLVKPFTSLFLHISLDDKQKFITLLPCLNRHIGRLIVNSVCRTSLSQMKKTLDEIVSESSKIDPELKIVITRYRQEQERTVGSEVWPEVERYIKPIAM
jgi:hypothetical protein